jgi:hypothetical protein
MSRQFPLALTASPQVLPISGGELGFHKIFIGFGTAPVSGYVSVEKRQIGSSIWEPISGGENLPIVAGQATIYTDGAIGSLRVSFIALDGGSAAALWLSSEPTAYPPMQLATDNLVGPSARLRVDPGQTGFFAGRFFRSYFEALIPVAGPAVQFRFTSPIDFILWSQLLELTQGAIEMRVYSGATSSGSWTARPIIGVNRMAQRPEPYYSPQCTFETGGNFTGGTEVDLLKLRSAAANNSASNVGGEFSERGLPAGVYHGRIQTLTGGVNVNDAAQLIYSLIFEERPQ